MSSENHVRRKITVVGGFYDELCHFPQFRGIFGSGGRGAAAIPKNWVDVELLTFVDEHHRSELWGLAEACGFKAVTSDISSIYRFEYLHPLASPVYFSPSIRPTGPIRATGDIILYYGMMEGTPVVDGDTVVYDPQSHNKASSFRANGSKARRLAIIANDSEAKHLTCTTETSAAASRLLVSEEAEVAVVKCGPDGALVASKEGVTRIEPYHTNRVFKIGSGDIFSAFFAYFWAAQGLSPIVAARNASQATAYYCQQTTVPIGWPLPEDFQPIPIQSRQRVAEVYLAGPFFSPQELWMVEECKRHLELSGLKVFSPFHHIGMGKPKFVAPADLQALKRCSLIFAILDGFDAGTLFEIGYGVNLCKPVIGLYHGKDNGNLTMLLGTDCKVYSDISSAVYSAAALR